MEKLEESAAKCGLVARDVKNATVANIWTLAWAISLGVISYLSDYGWYTSIWVAMVGFGIHAVIGVGMVLAFKKFLTEADELERKIQLDALALSVGVTIVFFSSYSVLEKAISIPGLSTAYLIVVLALAYSVGIIFGRRRYR